MNLKTLRLKAKLTREEVIKHLDISISTLARYEQYLYPVPSDIIIKMAELYNVSEAEVLEATKRRK